jgi:hypothetical protein
VNWMQPFLVLLHLLGLALALGAASVKVVLLLRCRRDRSFIDAYLKVVRPITRLLIAGLVLLTLTGVGWLLLGYPLTWLLWVKLALVATIWVLGPIVDKVAEPRFRRFAPAAGAPVSAEFVRAERGYLALETTATAIFCLIVGVWVFR